MARNLGIVGQRPRKRKAEDQGSPSIRVDIRGALVQTEDNELGGKSLVIAHPSGFEYVLAMDETANVALAELLVKDADPIACRALAEYLVERLTGIEIASEMPEPIAEGA